MLSRASKSFILVLFSIITCFVVLSSSSILYVDKSSIIGTGSPCGEKLNPCPSIKDGISQLNNQVPNTIIVSPGVYDGPSNREVTILNFVDLEIRNQGDEQLIEVDCQTVSFGFDVQNSTLRMSSFVFNNCYGIFGAAIFSRHSYLSLTQTSFYQGKAHLGAAIYMTSNPPTPNTQRSYLMCHGCYFSGNHPISGGGAIYMENSNAIISSSTIKCNSASTAVDVQAVSSDILFKNATISSAAFLCTGDSSVVQAGTMTSLCSQNSACDFSQGDTFSWNEKAVLQQCNNDGTCQGNENCLGCPQDCPSCSFSGTRFDLLDCGSGICTIEPTYPISLNQFKLHHLYTSKKQTGTIMGFFKVEQSSQYVLEAIGSNLGVNVFLNHIDVIQSSFLQTSFNQTFQVRVQANVINVLKVVFYTSSTDSHSNLTISLFENGKNILKPFFSQNVCGDGINDPNEKKCDIGGIKKDFPVCGDGTCNEPKESCLIDCYNVIGTMCDAQLPPVPTPVPQKDTVGYLLNNQRLFSLPGLNHLAHGLDLLTGEELPSYVFDNGYCDNNTFVLIQNMYRLRVHSIPPEYNAEISPECSFDLTSRVFESSKAYKEDKTSQSEISVSATVSGKYSYISASFSAAYSQSESVSIAKNMESMKGGKTVSTKSNCITSTVSRNSVRFHKDFVFDISDIISPDVMAKFIEKYGVFYYKSAVLGGSLETIINVKTSKLASGNSGTIEKSAEISFSGSISAPIGQVSADYSKSMDSSVTEESQKEFSDSSTSSHVIVKGGRVGSFGPDYSTPNNFDQCVRFLHLLILFLFVGDWSQSVDLSPVPIDYTLGLIGDIIPETWLTKERNTSKTMKNLWFQGYQYYLGLEPSSGTLTMFFMYSVEQSKLNITLTQSDRIALSNLTITFYSPDNKTSEMFMVSLPSVGCTKDGCMTEFIFKINSTWELAYVTVVNGSNSNLFDGFNNYVDELIVKTDIDGKTRGYLFHPLSTGTKQGQVRYLPVGIPESISNCQATISFIEDQITGGLVTCLQYSSASGYNVTAPIFPGRTPKLFVADILGLQTFDMPYTMTSNAKTLQPIRASYEFGNRYTVYHTYSGPSNNTKLFSKEVCSTISGSHGAFSIPSPDVETMTEQGYTIKKTKHKLDFFVGKVYGFQVRQNPYLLETQDQSTSVNQGIDYHSSISQSLPPIQIYNFSDPVIILWNCPNDPDDPISQLCNTEPSSLGYVNIYVGATHRLLANQDSIMVFNFDKPTSTEPGPSSNDVDPL
ncbi:hypothetical protein DFA_05122 [Cavenderia fasciculata]|uniref:MACPF domain-containing protein n=1 Tax=Cavenderia fasciculata TaxID=261658 RepID=F4PND9_CACFS|nr:uncharacterized protein DFA_05122 [Cavenderia fasciculata]EGG22992.1 hypothetical protein DFA_05122 [Cavenderia fasciculata]|eukprot:XP_004360843.1 hypothetical protein DFA_05122 [Cavenderia fasciculata]